MTRALNLCQNISHAHFSTVQNTCTYLKAVTTAVVVDLFVMPVCLCANLAKQRFFKVALSVRVLFQTTSHMYAALLPPGLCGGLNTNDNRATNVSVSLCIMYR